MYLCGLIDNVLININKSLEEFLQEILLSQMKQHTPTPMTPWAVSPSKQVHRGYQKPIAMMCLETWCKRQTNPIEAITIAMTRLAVS